jgi:hypothetical protein
MSAQIAAQTARTQGPWKLDSLSGTTIWTSITHPGCGPISGPIASVDACWTKGAQLANAAFIVQACNAHDDLVAALRECSEYLSDIPESAAGGDDEAGRLVRMAAAALNKAGSL